MGPVPLIAVAAVIAAMGWGAPAAGAEPRLAQAATEMMWCFDPARALVRRKPARDCRGRIITEEAARRIRLERVRRIQGRLRGKTALVPGKRLNGTGTGFFISASGQVVTNHHVIDNCDAVSVTPAGGKAGVAEVLTSDQARDLAWLRAPVTPPGFARFRKPVRVLPGEDVAVVGYPLHGGSPSNPFSSPATSMSGTAPAPKAGSP